jgi:hypothetical protein
MIGKTTRLLMISGMVLVWAGAAQGGTVIDIVDQILQDMDPDPDPPMNNKYNGVVFEDDDWTKFVDSTGSPIATATPGVGDRIIGIFDLPQLFQGAPTGTRNAALIGKTGSSYDIDDEGRELTGAFELEVISIDGSGIHLDDVAPGSRIFLTSMTAGTVYEMFEDTSPDFSAAGSVLATDKATAVDGTLWAEIGFTGSGTEFYTVVPTGTGTENVRFSLNFTVAPPAWTAGSPWLPNHAVITQNTLGTEIYAAGTLDIAGTSGKVYDRISDVDAVVIYAPVPAAVWPGIIILCGLGVIRKLRRRAK